MIRRDKWEGWEAGSTFHLISDNNRIREWHHLTLQAFHSSYLLGVFGEVHQMDARKEFLEVSLDDGWVLRLTQDLEQVVVSNEVESREAWPLLFQEVAV